MSSSNPETTPLLTNQIFHTRPRFLRSPPSLRRAARFLRRATSRGRARREPSFRVREAAAEQIEERQSNWGYSKPIVILDLVWNLTSVIISTCILIVSHQETPTVPLRAWIVGYILHCVFHMACVYVAYKRRYSQRNSGATESGGIGFSRNDSNSSSGSYGMESSGDYSSEQRQSDDETRHLETANTVFSLFWWIVGSYWVTTGGQSLKTGSPQLYWLCITLMAFEVFFVLLCVAVAFVIGIAVCCCLPCIIAILYAVADQEGATKEEIERLPRYTFRKIGNFEKQNGEIQVSFEGIMTECDTNSPLEHVLHIEDAECCICLCAYDDGTELRRLPCLHHFHSGCVDKWLHINATCPLCKLNILKNSDQSGSD